MSEPRGPLVEPARRAGIRGKNRLLFLVVVAAAALAGSALIVFDRAPAAPISNSVAAIGAAERGALGKPALVEFYSDECTACRTIMGSVAELDQRYDGRVKFIYMDTDRPETQAYLGRYDIRGMPTLALLDAHGKVTTSIAGWPGEQAVAESLDKLLAQ